MSIMSAGREWRSKSRRHVYDICTPAWCGLMWFCLATSRVHDLS